MGIGVCVGLFNGFVVAFLKVNLFIATLGSMSIPGHCTYGFKRDSRLGDTQ